MVVHVPVDRQGPAIRKRCEEALDLSSHLNPNLSAQPHGAPTSKSVCPECSEAFTKSAAAVDQQIELFRRGEGSPLEQIQMQADRELGTTTEFGNRMFPAVAVNDNARTAEPTPVIAADDGVCYAF